MRVRCIDNERFEGILEVGKEYKASDINGDKEYLYIELGLFTTPLRRCRFEKIDENELTITYDKEEKVNHDVQRKTGEVGYWLKSENKINELVDSELISNGEKVNHPTHYNKGKYEVIDVIEDWNLGFNLGNAIKYIARAEHKENALEDLKKAEWYIKREIERRGEK